MIVPAMTKEQIAKELDKADMRVRVWFSHNSKKIARELQRGREFYTVKLPVGAKRYDCATIWRAVKSDKNLLARRSIIWSESNKGKIFYSHAYNHCDYLNHELGGHVYVVYTPHFVSRYIERMGLTCTPLEGIIKYIKGSMVKMGIEVETGDAPTEKLNHSTEGSVVYVKTIDGIAVVDKIGNYWVYKTFMTDDMGLHREKEVIQALVSEFERRNSLPYYDQDKGMAQAMSLTSKMVRKGYREQSYEKPQYYELGNVSLKTKL